MKLVVTVTISCFYLCFGSEIQRIVRGKRNGIDNVKNAEELWNHMPISYVVSKNVSDPMRNAIVKALEMISSQTANCITFRDAENLFVDESEPFMEFQVKSSPICRAEATVGRRHRINYVQLEDSCLLRFNLQHLIIHEVLHSLGVDHEHSRTDRDKFVTVNWENIQDGKAIDFYVQSDEKFITYNLPYDYSSIMHYGPSFFSKYGGLLKTLEPIADVNYVSNYALMLKAQSRNDMSPKDVQLLKKMYKCDEDK